MNLQQRRSLYLLSWLLVGIAIVIYLRSLVLAYLSGGPITDDSVDLLGAIQHLDLYSRFFQPNARQIQVVMDLGFYGQLPKFAYLIPWFLIIKAHHPGITLEQISSIYIESWYTPPEQLASLKLPLYLDPLQYIYTHLHLYNTLFFLGTIILAGAASYEISKQRLSIPLSALLVLSFPFISGLSLFDSKDYSVAFFYTLFSYSLVKLREPRKLLHECEILTIFSASILCSLKIIFFPVLIATLLTMCVIDCVSNKSLHFHILRRRLKRTLYYALFIFTGSIALNPYILAHPLPRTIEAFKLFSNHSNFVETAISGQIVSAADYNWSTLHYIIRWTLSITPVYIITLALISYAALFYLLSRNSLPFSIRGLIPFLAQAWIFPLLAVANNSNIYDGMRHFIFSLFANIVILAIITSALIAHYHRTFIALLVGLGILLGSILPLADTYLLAPYQYAYKNEYSRSSPETPQSDADFWSFGAKELLASLSNKELLISHFDTSNWDYARLWTRYFGHALTDKGDVLFVFDRGNNLLRYRTMSCKRSYDLKRPYLFGSSQLILGAGTGCTSD